MMHPVSRYSIFCKNSQNPQQLNAPDNRLTDVSQISSQNRSQEPASNPSSKTSSSSSTEAMSASSDVSQISDQNRTQEPSSDQSSETSSSAEAISVSSIDPSLDENISSASSSEKNNCAPKKKVEFKPMAYVILIPQAAEFHNAGLAPLLWWSELDYQKFKNNFLTDINAYIQQKKISVNWSKPKELKNVIRQLLLSEEETDPNNTTLGMAFT